MAMGSTGGKEGNGSKGENNQMSEEQKMKMLVMHHNKTLWIYWLLIFLGFWMILAPSTFDYFATNVEPAGGRAVWLPPESRLIALKLSDIISGFLLIVLGFRSLKPNRPVSLWIACGVGLWLNFAPLLFWSPNPLIYLNDSLIGVLVIALTILIPGMPNMIHYMEMGPKLPPGWSYNPSSWVQRSILIGLGFAGWMVSRYLAAFQLGYIETVWEPFFGNGSRLVLTSKMSESLPISDGGLGAFAYTLEFIMGWMGSPARWRTMPWMVAFFGFLVIPLGLVHIFLVISQPVVVGYWCTFCLLAAAIMLPMIPLEVDEVIAMFQFMHKSVKEKGESFWKVFWKGGTIPTEEKQNESINIIEFPQHPFKLISASIQGMSFPWTLDICALIGIWLMFAPDILKSNMLLSNISHLGGALVLTFSVIAMGECIRTVRLINVLFGLTFILAPFIATASTIEIITFVTAGLTIIVLSLPRGKIKESFGTWDVYIK
jgi:hypothetical protein